MLKHCLVHTRFRDGAVHWFLMCTLALIVPAVAISQCQAIILRCTPGCCCLQEAMTNTKKLCAITLDTLGREMMVRRPCVFGEDGWPLHPDPVEVQAGQIVMLTTRQDVEAHDNVFPVTYPHLHMMVEPGDTIYIGRCVSWNR
eukprot:GHRR01027171.1.p1 GENE.GHRR01027171.1~~GHRR01027171.1.p1  ORF type:complete len:143 (-),score=25.42 GHRR01027171.1:163-591(-)